MSIVLLFGARNYSTRGGIKKEPDFSDSLKDHGGPDFILRASSRSASVYDVLVTGGIVWMGAVVLALEFEIQELVGGFTEILR
jgi:hypothetical protein